MSLPTQYNGKNQSPVGALSGTLARLQASRPLRELREVAKGVTKQLPDAIQARRAPRAALRENVTVPVCSWHPGLRTLNMQHLLNAGPPRFAFSFQQLCEWPALLFFLMVQHMHFWLCQSL